MNIIVALSNAGLYTKDGKRYNIFGSNVKIQSQSTSLVVNESSSVETFAAANGYQLVTPETAYTSEQQLAMAKTAKMASLQNLYEKSINKGITIDGVTLAAKDSDKQAFSQLIVHLRETEESLPEDQRAAFQASNIGITDLQGAFKPMTVAQVRTTLIAYGAQAFALWTNLAMKTNAVRAAATTHDVEAITL